MSPPRSCWLPPLETGRSHSGHIDIGGPGDGGGRLVSIFN